MPRSFDVLTSLRAYTNSRGHVLAMCRVARSSGNKIGLRSLQAESLFRRESAGMGRPRCRLTARPLTPEEQSMLMLRAA